MPCLARTAQYVLAGHVSEKTDTFAFGVVLCELLTGKGPVSADREMLQAKMYMPLADAERNLPPLLDARLGGRGGWPLPSAIALGHIARRCIEVVPDMRCVVNDVLVELDGLAGRKAVRRAVRGEEYDPMTGKLLKKPRALVAAVHGATRTAGAPSTNTS